MSHHRGAEVTEKGGGWEPDTQRVVKYIKQYGRDCYSVCILMPHIGKKLHTFQDLEKGVTACNLCCSLNINMAVKGS